MSYSHISVIGLGYIGLPTAALLADCMQHVIGVDVCRDVVKSVNAGKTFTIEPGLGELLKDVVLCGSLRATEQPEPADAFIIAVPTPITKDHKPDISFVRAAALSIAPVLRKGDLVILESTSPVGTTEQMAQWLAETRPDLSFPQQAGEGADIQIAYCPERILPGKMLEELANNDRIVGGLSEKASAMAVELYRIFVHGQIFTTTARIAELCKLTENSFRDVNIAFANELSMICDKLDIDVQELIHLANHHPRVNILQPGCGVGGHCIPVDPWFIVDSAPEDARLIRTAREVNDHKPDWVVEKVREAIKSFLAKHLDKTVVDVTVACWGLTYKPDTDDIRNSPALYIVENVLKLGCKVIVVDPYIADITKLISSEKVLFKSVIDNSNNGDIVCILVANHMFFEKYSYIYEYGIVINSVGLSK